MSLPRALDAIVRIVLRGLAICVLLAAARGDLDLLEILRTALLGDLRPERDRRAAEIARADRERLAAGGSVEVRNGFVLLRVRGDPYVRGLQQGRLLRDRIRERRSSLPPDEGPGSRLQLLARLPVAARLEIRGIAEGAGIAFDDALRLTCESAIADDRASAATTVADPSGGPALAVPIGDDAVVTIATPACGEPCLSLGPAGSLAALAALSSRGLALVPSGRGADLAVARVLARHAAAVATSRREAAEVVLPAVGGAGSAAVRLLGPGDEAGSLPQMPGRDRLALLRPRSGSVTLLARDGSAVDLSLQTLAAPPVLPPAPFDGPDVAVRASVRLEIVRSLVVGCRVQTVRFTSPRPSGDARNDRVSADLYEPEGARGAVILLPIWREREPVLERYVAAHLARRGLTTLVLPLPFQFERGPPDVPSGRWTVSDDLDRTRRVLVQAVAEARAVRRWLRERGYREDRIAVMGISLGGHVAALAYAADAGFAQGAFVLAGGDVADLLWNDSRETRWIKVRLQARGLDLATVRRLCEPVEPLWIARPWRGAGAILVAAAHDPIVPPANVRSLRAALGFPPVLWLDADHVSGLLRLPAALAWIADRLLAPGFPVQIPPPESR